MISSENRSISLNAASKRLGATRRYTVLSILLFLPYKSLCHFEVIRICNLYIENFAVYKLYYRFTVYKFEKQYTRGIYTPIVREGTLSDGRPSHVITFYGNDGDSIYVSKLGRLYNFSGGVARCEIADSSWFTGILEDNSVIEASLACEIVYQSGDRRKLPVIEFSISAPYSPVEIVSPKENDIAVNTSTYKISAKVVPGSTVMINGNDLTSLVTRDGTLDINVNVLPVGDNTYTMLVKTNGHLETRKSIVIYRAEMEIPVEVSSDTPLETSTNIVTISGYCEPGALISVDSDYVENSLVQDYTTGEFSFIAKLSTLGTNTVRFRASMPGKADSALSVDIEYMPNIDEYSRTAWAMDYERLVLLFEQWQGRVFLCKGVVKDIIVEDSRQYVIMDVGTEGNEQLLVLVNLSSIGTPTRGKKYSAYADVDGRYMSNGH